MKLNLLIVVSFFNFLVVLINAKSYGVAYYNPDGRGQGTFNAISTGIQLSQDLCNPILAALSTNAHNLRQREMVEEDNYSRQLGCDCTQWGGPPGTWCYGLFPGCRRAVQEQLQSSEECQLAIENVRGCISNTFPGIGVLENVFDKFGSFVCVEFE